MDARTQHSTGAVWVLLGAFCFGSLLMASLGCTPRVIVHANPSKDDNGIRFYRPKPYLKIEPAEVAVDKTRTELVPSMVKISLAYLPDFSEEYAIDVRTGCGTANVGIKLEDGWNLTEISQDLDSQTDENIEAISGLVKAVGGIVPTAAASDAAADISFTVPSRNVPIGFYESVVGRDGHGCKRLYGFRYVGFLPYAGCPVDMGGHEQACCGDGLQPLYGLTFDNGTMVFQPLDAMATTPIGMAGQSVLPTAAPDLQQLAIELRSALYRDYPAVGEVHVEQVSGRVVVQIGLPEEAAALPVQAAAEQWLLQRIGATDGFEVRMLVGA
ncbi:hypothetical protein [Roseimaritima ulvae]|uniref:Uncharacterized protein n=1 Tax=Roseimaritima ulvae TaxID=980254 RepID=A0A5B9QZC5_9BACT|nr:hypothetical protein [Roseimaritima ulvae]QEG43329.1 hypothetical protein UC8_53760 [Roseimaritima ulvae]